ncbi:MAG: NAD(P)/FAD-dependent oxidoreductase [Myxococcales bacterium]|nr:NAD(P)/FAD-dependent oxidoreductase [Myxococcales bacterium]
MGERIIIIGAGVAGLSAGIHAARCGFEVELFEHHSEPGGVCTSWRRGDYTIDGCIHWLMGGRDGDPYRALYESVGALDDVELRTIDVFTEVFDELTGDSLTFSRDLDGLLAQVDRIAPYDLPVFRELVDLARRSEGTAPPPVRDAPEVQGLWSTMVDLWHARDRLRLFIGSSETMGDVAERVRHPTLRFALKGLFVPEMPAAFMAMLLGELERGNLSTVVGGSRRFSAGMARRLAAVGGSIRYGADVDRIIVENDRAVGVHLTDGSTHRADHVISTAPGPTTIFRMLGGAYTDAKIRERFATWPMFGAVSLVTFGARRRWPDVARALQLRLAEPFTIGPDSTDVLAIRHMAEDSTLAPADGCVIQALVGGDFDFWHDVHHAPGRYGELKEQLAAEVCARLERHFPGLAAAEELVDVATPYTFWRFARSYRGAFEGWLPTMATIRTRVGKTLPGLGRFHMAGQWVEPGGGIPPSVTSGRHVVQMVCEEHGVPFVDLMGK